MSSMISISEMYASTSYAGETLYRAAARVFALPPYEAVLEQNRRAVRQFLAGWTAEGIFQGPAVYFDATQPRGGLVITESAGRRVFVYRDGRVQIDFGRPSVLAAAKILSELYRLVDSQTIDSFDLNTIHVVTLQAGVLLAADRDRLEPAVAAALPQQRRLAESLPLAR